MNLGRSIKRIRKAKGITGKYVSMKLGVDPSTLSKYESGERKVKGEVLPKIAEALGVSVADFFEEKVDETPTESV